MSGIVPNYQLLNVPFPTLVVAQQPTQSVALQLPITGIGMLAPLATAPDGTLTTTPGLKAATSDLTDKEGHSTVDGATRVAAADNSLYSTREEEEELSKLLSMPKSPLITRQLEGLIEARDLKLEAKKTLLEGNLLKLQSKLYRSVNGP